MLIGLSVNHKENMSCISQAYSDAVIQAGGTPVLIPLTNHTEVLDRILAHIDGLILSGGGDIHASFFNEELHPAVESCDLERDRYDLYLCRRAAALQMPVLGICRGHQVMNVAFGGSLIQDIPSCVATTLQHSQTEERDVATHTVRIAPESRLSQLLPSTTMAVNSFHHQALKTLADDFSVAATADDGVVEAIESKEGKALLGVQWHPENLTAADDTLFRYIVNEATLYQKAKEIHSRILSVDSHCDTPLFFRYGIDIGKRNPTINVNPKDLGATTDEKVAYKVKVDVPQMQDGMLDAVCMVAYLPQGKRDDKTLAAVVKKTESILQSIRRQVEKNADIVAIAHSATELQALKQAGKKAIFMGIENAYGLGKDIANVQKFAEMGVVYITLSHNGDNDVCDAAVRSHLEHGGLSEFGKAVVREMNRCGIMVDVSHTSEQTVRDVLAVSSKPIIASHSSAKALCNHPRNLSNELIRAIAAKGGVVQVCLYSGFLKKSGKANLKDAVDHIDHIVKTAGIDHVGIGSDFDGGGGIIGVNAANEMPQITMELLRRGYSETDIAKIWGGNLLRVLKQVQAL